MSRSLCPRFPASVAHLKNVARLISLNWDANAGHYGTPCGLGAWCKLPVMKAMMLAQLVSRQGVGVPCKACQTRGKCFKRVPFLRACIYVWIQAINLCTESVTRNGSRVAHFTMHRVFDVCDPLWRRWWRETLKQSTACQLQVKLCAFSWVCKQSKGLFVYWQFAVEYFSLQTCNYLCSWLEMSGWNQ